jgi:hypothetical protein
VKKVDLMDDGVCTIDKADEENNAGCQVRRKIEDYLEQRRYQDELGEPPMKKKRKDDF